EARAQARDGGELGLRSVLGDDDGARDAATPRVPGHTLGHVAGAGGPHAAGPLLRRGQGQGVAGAAQLERADRLEVLEFEVNLSARVVDVETNQRRAQG